MEGFMSLTVSKEKSFELKKHINAIHCSNDLTLVQRKLFNALLFNAYSELLYKQRFSIKVKELSLLIGYNSHDYGKLKKALLGLMTIAIEWNVIDNSTGKEKQWQASSVLASADLSNGLCTYEYSQVLKELLYQPEIYGCIDMELISKFQSSYGLALYENCIRYQRIPHTPWFNIDIFRKLMGVMGNKYTAFCDFKKRVIGIAVDEVNSISPISIFPEIERHNQKVTRIRFKLNKRTTSTENNSLPLQFDDDLIRNLSTTFGLSPQIINELSAAYDPMYIKEKMQLIMQSSAFQAGKIRGLAGYLMDALKLDYKASRSSQAVVNEQRVIKENKEREQKELDEKRKERYSKYFNTKIESFLSSLSEEEYQKLMCDFEHFIKNENKFIQAWYAKEKLEHPGAKACFDRFLCTTRQNDLGQILSYDDFLLLISENH